MRLSWLSGGLFVTTSAALAISSTNLTSRATSGAPPECSTLVKVLSLFETQANAQSNDDDYDITVEDAFNCLSAIPLRPTDARLLIESVRRILQFHSSLAYLKDPKQFGRVDRSPVDLMAGLDMIEQSIPQLATQYNLEVAISRLLMSALDSHLYFRGHLSTSVLMFSRDDSLSLASLSEDGVQAPKVYRVADLTAGVQKAVTEINDEPVTEFLTKESDLSTSYTDQDTRYQSMFIFPLGDDHERGVFLNTFAFPSKGLKETKLTFEDGTSLVVENQLRWQPTGWNAVETGADMYDTFVKAPISAEATSSAAQRQQITAPRQRRTVEQVIDLGFRQLEQEEVALFILSSFNRQAGRFHKTISDFVESLLARPSSMRPTKLIIDLRGNTGGVLSVPHMLISALFPGANQLTDLWRFRSHKAMDIIGNYIAQNPPATGAGFAYGPFLYSNNFQTQQSRQTETFRSWADLYGPVRDPITGDDFSQLYRPFEADDYFDHKAPLFTFSNIAIISDGRCGSMCNLFVELLTHLQAPRQTSVKIITVGGLPLADDDANGPPTTATASTKGALVKSSEFFVNLSQRVRASYSPGVLPDDIDGALPFPPPVRVSLFVVNLADTVRVPPNLDGTDPDPDEDDGSSSKPKIPSQFIFDQSHCRFYYTEDMIFEDDAIYTHVHDVAWGNPRPFEYGGNSLGGGMRPELCVRGSFRSPGFY